MSCIRQHWDQKDYFSVVITEEYLRFKVYFCGKCYDIGREKLGQEVIKEVMYYQPPWLGAALVKILRGKENVDQGFYRIAFKHCSRGDDLEYIVKEYERKKGEKKPVTTSKLSLKSIKKLGQTLKAQKYTFLSDQLILDQAQFTNLVAESTYDKDEAFRTQSQLFFRLMTSDPDRAMNYAVNYMKDVNFVMKFMLEGMKRSVIRMKNALLFVLRYLYFAMERETKGYVRLQSYKSKELSDIIASVEKWQRSKVSSSTLTIFKKQVKNYQASQICTSQFIDLYVKKIHLFKFITDEPDRKNQLLEIRQQPMSKQDATILRQLCQTMKVDIIELSLYDLFGRVNSRDQIDQEAWSIVQKLSFWAEDREVVFGVVRKMAGKVESLVLLVRMFELLKESSAIFGEIITEEHLQILSSLAAIEQDNAFFGIIPENFFSRQVGVYHDHARGMLSETHKRIVKQSGAIENIFVLSKALYFMYGCDADVEKVILAEFSLRQQDSQEFEELKKRVKEEMEN